MAIAGPSFSAEDYGQVQQRREEALRDQQREIINRMLKPVNTDAQFPISLSSSYIPKQEMKDFINSLEVGWNILGMRQFAPEVERKYARLYRESKNELE